MTYVAIDDNTIEDYEVNFIIKNTSHLKTFYCIDLTWTHNFFYIEIMPHKIFQE